MKIDLRKIFLTNLINFLMPVLICVFIMSLFCAMYIYSERNNQIKKTNEDLNYHMKENIESMLNEVNSIAINVSHNPHNLKKIEQLLEKPFLTNSEANELEELTSSVNATVSSKLYIVSVYIYIENDLANFITTDRKFVNVDYYYDNGWLDTFKNLGSQTKYYAQKRTLQRYSFEGDLPVFTSYRALPVSNYANNGVVVLNIDENYITKFLSELNMYEGQQFLIKDSSGNVIYQFNNSDNNTYAKSSDITSTLHSENNNWSYISIVPKKIIYEKIAEVFRFAICFFFIIIVIGVVCSVVITYKRQQKIIHIFSTLKKIQPHYSVVSSNFYDEYGYISENIAQILIELTKQKYQQRILELQASQLQITPHFLANTLESIKWECIGLTGKENEASLMLDNLAILLKYSMSNPEKTVPMIEELRHAKTYVDILKYRYGNKFDVIWCCDEDISDLRVLKLTLQPLIENSLYHGIKENPGHSYLKIKASRKENYIVVEVIDTGIGMSKEKLQTVISNLEKDLLDGEHIGLPNINRRLRLFYNGDYGIKIRSYKGLGTSIRLTFPTQE